MQICSIFYAVVRQISVLFIDSKDSVFCIQNVIFFSGRQLKAHPHNYCYELCIPLLCSKLSTYSFSVEEHAVYHIEFISQRQGEETHVDPLFQSLFVEHHHVDDVGRTTNQKQEGQKNGALKPFSKGFHLEANKVVGVVPRKEAVELQDFAAF